MSWVGHGGGGLGLGPIVGGGAMRGCCQEGGVGRGDVQAGGPRRPNGSACLDRQSPLPLLPRSPGAASPIALPRPTTRPSRHPNPREIGPITAQGIGATYWSSKKRKLPQCPKALREFTFHLSGRPDSNRRPLQPHCSALPGCATSRREPKVYAGRGALNSSP